MINCYRLESDSPFDRPVTWPRRLWRMILPICVVSFILLLLLPDSWRAWLNASHRKLMPAHELLTMCRDIPGGKFTSPVYVPGRRRACTVYYSDGSYRIDERQ